MNAPSTLRLVQSSSVIGRGTWKKAKCLLPFRATTLTNDSRLLIPYRGQLFDTQSQSYATDGGEIVGMPPMFSSGGEVHVASELCSSGVTMARCVFDHVFTRFNGDMAHLRTVFHYKELDSPFALSAFPLLFGGRFPFEGSPNGNAGDILLSWQTAVSSSSQTGFAAISKSAFTKYFSPQETVESPPMLRFEPATERDFANAMYFIDDPAQTVGWATLPAATLRSTFKEQTAGKPERQLLWFTGDESDRAGDDIDTRDLRVIRNDAGQSLVMPAPFVRRCCDTTDRVLRLRGRFHAQTMNLPFRLNLPLLVLCGGKSPFGGSAEGLAGDSLLLWDPRSFGELGACGSMGCAVPKGKFNTLFQKA